jgi:hypothetical protein
MATTRPEPSGTEAMAFQLVLAELRAHQKGLQALQQAQQQQLTLLAKIVGLLEAQGRQPAVPVATWEETYAAPEDAPVEPINVTPASPRPRALLGSQRLAQWFVKEMPDESR